MEDTTPLPVFPTLLIREAQLTDHSKLMHFSGQVERSNRQCPHWK